MKEKNRYAVIKTTTVQGIGSYKDIYLTYTDDKWYQSLKSLGVTFLEQIPMSTKLACVIVRYTTAPTTQQLAENTADLLWKEKASNFDDDNNNDDDDDDDEGYDPTESILALVRIS